MGNLRGNLRTIKGNLRKINGNFREHKRNFREQKGSGAFDNQSSDKCHCDSPRLLTTNRVISIIVTLPEKRSFPSDTKKTNSILQGLDRELALTGQSSLTLPAQQLTLQPNPMEKSSRHCGAHIKLWEVRKVLSQHK